MLSTQARSTIPPGYQTSAPRLSHVRAIWAAVTYDPTATLSELRAITGLSNATIGRALHALRFAGYIDFDPSRARARVVLVPFAIIAPRGDAPAAG